MAFMCTKERNLNTETPPSCLSLESLTTISAMILDPGSQDYLVKSPATLLERHILGLHGKIANQTILKRNP